MRGIVEAANGGRFGPAEHYPGFYRKIDRRRKFIGQRLLQFVRQPAETVAMLF